MEQWITSALPEDDAAMIAVMDGYGQASCKVIEWRPSRAVRLRVSSGWTSTRERAESLAWSMARSLNWTPPRWWQWWRWQETERRPPTSPSPSKPSASEPGGG